jgi:hypothetical protein
VNVNCQTTLNFNFRPSARNTTHRRRNVAALNRAKKTVSACFSKHWLDELVWLDDNFHTTFRTITLWGKNVFYGPKTRMKIVIGCKRKVLEASNRQTVSTHSGPIFIPTAGQTLNLFTLVKYEWVRRLARVGSKHHLLSLHSLSGHCYLRRSPGTLSKSV